MPSEHVPLEQMQRLHPLTLVHRFFTSIPALFVALLPALRNPDAGVWFYLGSLVLYGIFVIPLIVVQYVRYRYAITRKEVVIHKGVFTYRHRNIPIERIQNIEIEQSLLSRVLGTAKVKIETAGSSSTEGVIEYVSLAQAHTVRSTIRAHQEARLERPDLRERPSAAEEPISGAPLTEREAEPDFQIADALGAPRTDRGEKLLHTMTIDRVLLSGVFRFSLLYIVVIFSATEYLGLTPDEIARWFAGDRLEAFTAAMEASPSLVVAATILMIGFLAWVTGLITNFNRFYGFRLVLEDDKLHTRQGFLTVSEGTIPLKKIQAFVIRSNLLMSVFGWYRLELQTMGFDPSDRGYQVAAPFARSNEVMEIVRSIRPIEEPSPLESVSRLMIRRTFVRYGVTLTIAALAAGFFWTPALWAFAALPALFFVAVQQYRHHGYRASDDYLFVRRGFFRQSLWIMPVERFQVFYLSQSLFQRRLGLRSVYVDTPGAGVMAHAIVADLPEATGSGLLLDLYQTFQDRLSDRESDRSVRRAAQ